MYGRTTTTRHREQFGFFSYPPILPSFADGMIEMDHSYDTLLSQIYKNIYPQHLMPRYSPLPNNEAQQYNSLNNSDKQYMRIRNPLLLSRLFIRNAKLMNLAEKFAHKDKIRILDVGCGMALNLMGILAYFGINRVEYTGIDIVDLNITSAVLAYENLPHVAFIKQDAIAFLSNPKYAQQFDLVLFQHPDFQSCNDIFSKLFINAKNVIADNGIIYSTFYLASEASHFQKMVLPLMGNIDGYQLMKSDAYSDQAQFVEYGTSERACSENYVFMSPPIKHEYIQKLTV